MAVKTAPGANNCGHLGNQPDGGIEERSLKRSGN